MHHSLRSKSVLIITECPVYAPSHFQVLFVKFPRYISADVARWWRRQPRDEIQYTSAYTSVAQHPLWPQLWYFEFEHSIVRRPWCQSSRFPRPQCRVVHKEISLYTGNTNGALHALLLFKHQLTKLIKRVTQRLAFLRESELLITFFGAFS